MGRKGSNQFWSTYQRKRNLLTVLDWIRQAHKKKKAVDKQKLIATIQMELGTSQAKAKEYIKLLKDSEKIRITGDIIFYIHSSYDDHIKFISGGKK